MIKSVFLKGFKSFSEMTTADLAELLVVAGPNSCGKSTLIQAMLLLAQTLENPRQDVVLDLGGSYVQFAELRDATFGRPANANAQFTVGFNLNLLETDPVLLLRSLPSLPPFLRDRLVTEIGARRRIPVSPRREYSRKNSTTFSVTFGATRSGKPILQSLVFRKKLGERIEIGHELERAGKTYIVTTRLKPIHDSVTKVVDSGTFATKITDLTGLIKEQSIKISSGSSIRSRIRLETFIQGLLQSYGLVERQIAEIFGSVWEEIGTILLPPSRAWSPQLIEGIATFGLSLVEFACAQEVEHRATLPVGFDHFFPAVTESSFEYGELNAGLEDYISAFTKISFGTLRAIRQFLTSFEYIGPLRARPERAYLPTGTPLDIGKSGENAVPILWLEQSTKVSTKTRLGQAATSKRLDRAVQDWFEEFGIAKSLHVTKPKRVIYQAELDGPRGSGTKVTIADVGFGVSQLLPVIVAGLRAPAGSTLIFEQPEIHLHPQLQAKLADFLLCLIELGKRVIVETHSEHLINTLRLRTVEDTSGKLQNSVRILFVQAHTPDDPHGGKGSYISNLELDKYGQVVNWPVDFFPEHGDLNERLLRAIMAKHARG